jgi:hypothetical protein
MGSSTSAPEPQSYVTSVRLTTREHAALKRIAALDRRSLSNELRHLIAQRAAELERGA